MSQRLESRPIELGRITQNHVRRANQPVHPKTVLAENSSEVATYKAGKLSVTNFLFGQVMRKAGGKANPQVVRAELEKQLQ